MIVPLYLFVLKNSKCYNWKMKKRILILILSISIFLISPAIFAEKGSFQTGNAGEAKTTAEQKQPSFRGPQGKPWVKGPTAPPPSHEEILKMRGVYQEKNIFQKI